MFDLIATNPGVDPQARAAARLLAAVIAQAIKDAATKPIRFEKSCKFNINPLADQSIRWLFEPGTVFEGYCRLIGLEPQAVRDALLSDRKLHQARAMQSIFSDQDRRIISVRYLWLQNQLNDPSGFRTKLDEYAEKRNSRHKNGEDIAELTEFAEV